MSFQLFEKSKIKFISDLADQLSVDSTDKSDFEKTVDELLNKYFKPSEISVGSMESMGSSMVSKGKISKGNISKPSNEQDTEPRKRSLSGYQLFMKVMSFVYTSSKVKSVNSMYTEQWKLQSEENKKIFSENAKDLYVVTEDLLNSLSYLINIVQMDVSFKHNYSTFVKLKKILKAKKIDNTETRKWSEISELDRIEWFNKYESYYEV